MTREPRDERIQILAPIGRDGEMLADTLRTAGLDPIVCRDAAELAQDMTEIGALVLAEEALTPPVLRMLKERMDAQPAWSDVPLVLLTRSGRPAEPSTAVVKMFQLLGNVTLVERPVRVMTLVTLLESAVRARRRQYEVRDFLRAAVAESRAKDEFLAMLGHELRNPLAAIAAASQLLGLTAPAGDDRSAPARGIIARQVRHLTRMVDDLLDMGRVTSGKIELVRRSLDVAVAVANSVAGLRATGRTERHVIEVDATPVWVEADEVRLEQIVTNLLVNALKYTPDGGRIHVTVAREGDAAVIRVRDTGVGIAPDLLPRVFELFVQGTRPSERVQSGLGIGLTLVRRLVELHGGAVEAVSDGPGRGSTFVVRLPVRQPRRVLVVADQRDAGASVAGMLKRAGHEVFEASDGTDGLDIALRVRPDVALIDIGVPRLGGFDVAARLRATPGVNGMMLVALTGAAAPDDRYRAAEAGFDDYLVGPITDEQLDRALARKAA